MRTWILTMMMVVGMAVNAQEKRERLAPLTLEQRTELRVKKMTLALDLNEQQQKEVSKLLLERGKEKKALRKQHIANKKAGKGMIGDERLAMKSRMLDKKTEMNAAMQQILTPEQFDKLSKMKKQRHEKITKREKKFKNQNRR